MEKNKRQEENVNSVFDNFKDDFTDMISFFRAYPDYFIDYIKTENTMYDLVPFQRVYLRGFFRYKKLGIVASRGISKCVTGNTLISTDNGLVKIGDLANWSKEEKEDFVNNYVMNIHGEMEVSDVIFSNGLKDTKKITTTYGYELEGTHVHPILVMNDVGDIVFKTMSEVSDGDYVAINRKGVFGKNTKLNFDMETYIDRLNKNQYKVKHIDVPKELTEDFAYYLGMLQGDGCLTQNNYIIFTTADEQLLNFFTKFNKEVFSKNTNKRNSSKYDYTLNSVYIREYLKQIGFGYGKADEKVIPQCIMSAPKNIVAKFLRGLYDTDGTASNLHVSITTASKEMAIQIQQLLLNFGIVSKRARRFNKKYQTYSYQIYIQSYNIGIFNEEIGFGLSRKQDIVNKNCNLKRNPNTNNIPHQQQRVSRMVLNNDNIKNDTYKHVLTGDNQLSYLKVKKLLSEKCVVDEDFAVMMGMFEDNFFWDKIESIEDGEDYVYDFHVPESHTFVGNGFINHNTYLNVLAHYIKCVLYPNNHLCLAMPTKEQSAKVVKEKVEEYWRDYPILKNELIISKCKFEKDYVKLVFKNGSTLDTLTVGESSRGLRANGISLEEITDERMDRKTINEVLLPILAQPRRIPIYGTDYTNEYSKTQAYVTTASNKQSYCYEKFANLYDEMVQGKPTLVLGTSYEMGTRFGTLDAEDVAEKADDPTYSPMSFDREYKSLFTGSSERSLVTAEDINACRVLEKPENKSSKDDKISQDVMYVLSYDVARAEGNANAQSSLAVIKCVNRGDGTYRKQLVNMYTMEGTHFKNQAKFLKKKVNEFGASILCIDNNGLGRGLTDELVQEIDENPPYGVVNDSRYDIYKKPNSVPLVFLVSSNSRETKNDNIINQFMTTIANHDLQILKSESSARGFIKEKDPYDMAEKLLPYIQTDRLIDEIMNLEYVQKGTTTTIKQVSRKIQKDRYSALAYGLYYIYLEEIKNKNKRKKNDDSTKNYIAVKKPKYKVFS